MVVFGFGERAQSVFYTFKYMAYWSYQCAQAPRAGDVIRAVPLTLSRIKTAKECPHKLARHAYYPQGPARHTHGVGCEGGENSRLSNGCVLTLERRAFIEPQQKKDVATCCQEGCYPISEKCKCVVYKVWRDETATNESRYALQHVGEV